MTIRRKKVNELIGKQEDRVKRSVARKDSASELGKSIWAVDCDKIADEVRSRAGIIDFWV